MKLKAYLAVPADVRADIWRHLFSDAQDREQAAFMFVRKEAAEGEAIYRHVEWAPVTDGGFEYHSSAYIELTDDTRAKVIKRAHDLSCSLVEVHSHTGPWPAAFSYSDIEGLREFAPHVLWRLKGRPYFAIVVARTGFDALGWA
ncbi:MAG TPA: Mov34/MPN/PAD-1 family protein, partial [Tepidiformaceae bacterium]|nr:Mov34/MPN/PAD-1 family protein [Tepidiformaceae bacterium]